MPFGLKLRRTKRYNVLSKNCFVVTIYLLDNVKIELTQSMDNTGLHCLEATAQRLGLEESSYFGLWYFAKDHHSRWVDLEKSLKKQLEKYASEHVLYFGVMFYVPSMYHPKEGNVRYQYYLQLKKDVLEERFQCTVEQYIFLATLAILVDSKHDNRAEAQDSFLEKVFPVAWTKDKDIQEELYNKLEMKHKDLSGISAEEAEMLYIKEVENMDGYSQECFHVKDSHGNNVNLCTFFAGIFVEDSSGQLTAIYRWNDIGNITHNKSTIVLELNRKEETVPFHTDDIENSKYMSRLFATRLKFYKDNKIYTEQTTTPPVVRRRPTWKRTSMSRQQSIHPQRHIQNNEIYISEDIFHMNEEPVSYRPISQTSLDGYPEMNFINGTVPNGSVSSSHSINSLNHLQNLTQASPRSSNLSITASDIMALDFRAKCRHSATIVPSYRPTPEYDTVMRQKNRGILSHDNQSQPLRNLNMGNAHAYRHRDSLVYGQAEVPERLQYVVQYGSHGSYNNKPINPSEHMTHIGVTPSHEHIESISHTVSTPELANVLRHPTQCFNSARKLRNRSSLPPPQYPQPRPASSTPDLASHRHKYVSSSSPDLVTRKVQQSVKTFQEDSAPVARQSFQETSELLMRPTHRPTVKKRHSLEVVNNMVCGMEAMAIHSLNAPLPRRNTLRELVHTEEAAQKDHEVHHLPMYHHKKNISDATMLIHSSDSEEDEEEAHTSVPHACSANRITYSYQLQAALARMPNKPPPEYPGPRKSISNGALRHDPSCISAAIARTKAMSPRVQQAVHISRSEQATLNGTSLGPSLSEPDLTSVKERVKKEPVKERPVSEMFSIEDTIVEKEIMLRNLERSKVATLEAQKRPLMLAALNGLSASSFTAPEDKQAETTKMPMDERYRALRRKLEEGMVFTEYESLPKRKPDGVFTTALLPENQERNRIREVIPYEENRVELVPTKENLTGYINASHIKVTVGKEDLHYIATQSPLPHTFHEFWQMVWEQGVNVIAMMSTEEEEGRDQSHRYWPKLASRQNSATYGKFKVTTNFRTDAGPHAITGLKLNHLLSGQERTIWHLQFTDWPDHGCPEEAQAFLSYLEEINVVYSHAKNTQDASGPRNPPVVVHCSAGVGRTGVLILTDLMSRCWQINENVEIPAMLKHLRDQRMFMVQTIAQYKFVYQVLIQFIESTRLV